MSKSIGKEVIILNVSMIVGRVPRLSANQGFVMSIVSITAGNGVRRVALSDLTSVARDVTTKPRCSYWLK